MSTDSIIKIIIKNLNNDVIIPFVIRQNNQIKEVAIIYVFEGYMNKVTYREGNIFHMSEANLDASETLNTIIKALSAYCDVLSCVNNGSLTDSLLKKCKFVTGSGDLNLYQFWANIPFKKEEINIGLLL